MSILPISNARVLRIYRPVGGGNPRSGYGMGAAGSETTVWEGEADCWLRRKLVRKSRSDEQNVYTETRIDVPAHLGYVDTETRLTVRDVSGRVFNYKVEAISEVGVGLDSHPYYHIIAERE